MIWLPDHDVGVVTLTNADLGGALRAAPRRRLLEVLFDGASLAKVAMRRDESGIVTFTTITSGTDGYAFKLAADNARGARLIAREVPAVYVFHAVESGRRATRRRIAKQGSFGRFEETIHA